MKKLTVTIEGEEWTDLEYALDEVKRHVEQEYVQGHNRNETGSYFFSVTKEGE